MSDIVESLERGIACLVVKLFKEAGVAPPEAGDTIHISVEKWGVFSNYRYRNIDVIEEDL